MAPHLLYILTKIRPKNNFSNLAITFDHDLQMTRNWYGSKALVEAHLFRGVSSQSGHFAKIGFSNQNDQTETPNLYILSGGSLTILYILNRTPQKCREDFKHPMENVQINVEMGVHPPTSLHY